MAPIIENFSFYMAYPIRTLILSKRVLCSPSIQEYLVDSSLHRVAVVDVFVL